MGLHRFFKTLNIFVAHPNVFETFHGPTKMFLAVEDAIKAYPKNSKDEVRCAYENAAKFADIGECFSKGDQLKFSL